MTGEVVTPTLPDSQEPSSPCRVLLGWRRRTRLLSCARAVGAPRTHWGTICRGAATAARERFARPVAKISSVKSAAASCGPPVHCFANRAPQSRHQSTAASDRRAGMLSVSARSSRRSLPRGTVVSSRKREHARRSSVATLATSRQTRHEQPAPCEHRKPSGHHMPREMPSVARGSEHFAHRGAALAPPVMSHVLRSDHTRTAAIRLRRWIFGAVGAALLLMRYFPPRAREIGAPPHPQALSARSRVHWSRMLGLRTFDVKGGLG
jgi:hypothetical protein